MLVLGRQNPSACASEVWKQNTLVAADREGWEYNQQAEYEMGEHFYHVNFRPAKPRIGSLYRLDLGAIVTRCCDVLMLVRAPPGSAGARAALAHAEALGVEARQALLVFFHGPAVALATGNAGARWLAVARLDNARLWLCEAAWRRRFQTAPAPGFEVSSLIQFWQQALACQRLESYGS